VIISLGGNDFIQGVPKDEMRQDYNKIISRLQNGGSIVMILGVPGYTYSYSGLARDHKVSYVSNILRGVITNPDLMSDPIHPNDAGYSKIANRIAPELRRLITY
jgi:lysophospholipase L1-like esterase